MSVIVGSLIPGPALEAVPSTSTTRSCTPALTSSSWCGSPASIRRTVYPLIAAVLLALGIGLDLLQGLTETRTFDWYDIAMNCAGVIVGLALSLSLLGGWCQRVEQRLLS